MNMSECVCVLGVSASTFERADMGIAEIHGVGKMKSALNYQMNSLPPTLPVFLFPLRASLGTRSLLVWLLEGLLSMVLKVSSHILCVSFENSRLQSALAALQKQCIQFVWTKSVPALGSPAQKSEALSFKTF